MVYPKVVDGISLKTYNIVNVHNQFLWQILFSGLMYVLSINLE